MSMAHIIVVAVIAFIVLGPDKLPQVARTMGKMMAELRRITGDFRTTVETEMRQMEKEVALKEVRANFPEHVHYDVQQAQEAATAPSQPVAVPPVPPAPAAAGTAPAPRKPSDGEPTPA